MQRFLHRFLHVYRLDRERHVTRPDPLELEQVVEEVEEVMPGVLNLLECLDLIWSRNTELEQLAKPKN